MSTFYLLPSRPMLGERFARYLSTLFPGLDWTSNAWSGLADALCEAVLRQPDVFVVYREELPEDSDATTALTDGFGAVAGDDVIEIHPEPKNNSFGAQRWKIGHPRT